MSSYWRLIRLSLAVFISVSSSWAMGQHAVDPTLSIPLFPDFDRFGNQFSVVQTWEDNSGPRTAFSIYDTGASVVTLSANDQALFELITPGNAVPIKSVGGASATAIGGSGTLTGDVSNPGTVRAAGMSAFNLDLNDPLNVGVDPNAGIAVPGIQMFVGTPTGSAALPTIVGTPIHIPSSTPNHEQGSAALIDMRSYQLDLEALLGDSSFAGIFLPVPDVSFVPRGATLTGKSDTFESITIPVTLYGEDNTAAPGNLPSASFNPVVHDIRTTKGANVDDNRTFLFDTGAQLSVISTETALQLGLDLNAPEDTIDIQGASGTATIPGFTIDTLRVPRDVPGTFLEFTNVPVYVLDIGEGIDGILGMNLFNGADQLVYDPFRVDGPVVEATFLFDRSTTLDEDLAEAFPTFSQAANAEIQALMDQYVLLLEELEELLGEDIDIDAETDNLNAQLAPLLTGYGSRFAVQGPLFIGLQPIPEPATGFLLLSAAASIGLFRRRMMQR